MVRLLEVNGIGSSHRKVVLKVLPWEGGIVRLIIPEGVFLPLTRRASVLQI
jgi:hypothetical protein